jgi:hypothetical protein
MRSNKRMELNSELFNHSNADLMVFPGHSFRTMDELLHFQRNISNIKTQALFDLEGIKNEYIGNISLLVKHGEITFLSHQLFATSKHVNSNKELVTKFIDEFQKRRVFKIKNQTLRLFHCGEINILRNEQSNHNQVYFRLKNEYQLENRFKDVLRRTDIIVNIQHTQMGNQGKLHKRRQYLSKNCKWYFSTTNSIRTTSLADLTLQYAFFNGSKHPPVNTYNDNYYLQNEYETKLG